jgi:hypothetical protein
MVILALATFLGPNILFSTFTFSDDVYGMIRGHLVVGWVLHGLMFAWLVVFVGMSIRHRWKALWSLPLLILLYIAETRWAVWICC